MFTINLTPSVKAPRSGPKSVMLLILMMIRSITLVKLECEIPYLTKCQ